MCKINYKLPPPPKKVILTDSDREDLDLVVRQYWIKKFFGTVVESHFDICVFICVYAYAHTCVQMYMQGSWGFLGGAGKGILFAAWREVYNVIL